VPFLKDDMKENKDGVKKQVMYLGRWVDRENFIENFSQFGFVMSHA